MNYEVLRVLKRIRDIYASYPLSTESKQKINEAINCLMQVYVVILPDVQVILNDINSGEEGKSNNFFDVQPVLSNANSGVYALLEGLRKVYKDDEIINILKTTQKEVSLLHREELQFNNYIFVKYSESNVKQFREALYNYAKTHDLKILDTIKETNSKLQYDDFLVAAKMFNVCVVIIDENTNTKPPKVDKRVLHPNLSLAADGIISPFKQIIDVTTCEKTIYIGHRDDGKNHHHWELLIPKKLLNEIIKAKRLNPAS